MVRTSIAALLALHVALGSVLAQPRAEANLPYVAGPSAQPLQRFDLVTPAVKDFPTVVFIHGGSLTSGDKADGQRFAAAALNVGKSVPVHVIPGRTHITALAKIAEPGDPALNIILAAIRGR